MEVAVVEKGGAHSGQAEGQGRQIGVDAQSHHHGSNDSGAGDHSGGAGALGEPHNHADDNGHQDTGDAGGHDDIRHHLSGAGGVDDRAQGAAGGGDKDDGAGVTAGFLHQIHALFAAQMAAEEESAHAQGDEQRHNGLAQEAEDGGGTGARSQLSADGVGKDEDDGNQQGGEGKAGAGELFGLQQGGKVAVLQVLAGFNLGVDLIQHFQLGGGVLAAVDFVGDHQVGVLLAEVPEQEDGEDEQGDGDKQAVDDVHTQVKLQPVFLKGAHHSQRAGGGGNHKVGDVQAHAQDAAQPDHGFLGEAGELLGQGGEDNKAGIAEDGDGDHEAGEAQNHVAVLNANELQDGQRHLLGGAALFQENTHDTAKADDHADAGHGVTKAGGDGLDAVHQGTHLISLRTEGHCQNGDKDSRNNQRGEGMELVQDDQRHHHNNADEHCKYRIQSHDTTSLFLCCFSGCRRSYSLCSGPRRWG